MTDEDATSMNTPCDTGEIGACSEGTQVCTTGFYACTPNRVPEGESCNAIDDDCDGFVDEALLNACGRCGLTPSEVCDGFDNDCDGVLDEGELCPDGKTCSLGICANDCISNECPDPTKVCVDQGCVPQCLAAQCPEGFNCRDGQCFDSCDGITCPAGEVCAGGRCVGDTCYLTGCDDGLRCESGECVIDHCADTQCPPNHFCRQDGEEASCVPSCATVACGYGEHCTDGTCVQNECHRIVCPDSIECVSGECDTNCAGIICPRGQTCLSGQCRHDPCFNVDCPNGQRCALIDATAQCIADWQNEADMNSGDAIVPNTSDDLGIDRPDTSFTPSTYDQSITPPSFMFDGGVNNSADSNTESGCDCSQNPRNHAPPVALLFSCALFVFTRRRRG